MLQGEWCIYMMFFRGRNFVSGLLCRLKPKQSPKDCFYPAVQMVALLINNVIDHYRWNPCFRVLRRRPEKNEWR